MSIRNKHEIKVYNEMPTQINLVGQHRTYIFPAAVDGVPSMNKVDFADIEYAHSRGIVFSSGLLVFDESEREDIYKELRLNDWREKVWLEKDIEDVINNPTAAAMQRIIDINSLIVIERIRGKIVHAVNNNLDISNKVVTIVNTRFKEISSGIMKSRIVIRPTDVEAKVDSKKIEDLERKIAEMSRMMESMASATAEPNEAVPVENTFSSENSHESEVHAPAKKSSTRKRTSAKA